MKKIVSILCALALILSTLTAFAATEYEVREDMAMSYGNGFYISESDVLKEICAKTGYNDFEYGYIVTYGGGYGGGGADASLPIDDTKGAAKLVFDARIINDDFCTTKELFDIMFPEEEHDLTTTYPAETTCDVSVQCHWEDEYSEEIEYPWIDISAEWKHYEVDITAFDRCRVYINPLGASANSNEICAAIVANLKLVGDDESADITTEPVTEEPKDVTPSIPGVYGDAPSEWARPEIEKANGYGLLGDWVTGYTTPIIRAEFAELMSATVLKSLGKTREEYLADFDSEEWVSPFSDIDSEAVTIAYLMGITDGVGDDLFAPDKNITRQEIAVMMCRAITYVQGIKDKVYIEISDDLSAFSDEELVADWAMDGVGTLAKYGIMNGTTDTTLSPLDNTTVEQAIALAVRIYEIIK